MKFNVKNYPRFNITSYEKEDVREAGESLNEPLKTNVQLSLLNIINELNNSSLLNIPDQDEVTITFENFTWFGKIKTKIKNLISKTNNEESFESSAAHYDKKTKSIHLFNGIFEPNINNDNFKSSYQKLIDSISNKEFLINFFTLHEIGHAIHAKVVNNQNFNNLTDHFRQSGKNSLYYEQSLIFRENFADMFAAITLLKIDENNKNLINELQYLSDFRKDIQDEKYYTFNNLNRIISDFKNDNLQFTKVDDLLEYINSNTNKEIKIRLKESLQEILSSQEHNKQLGYLSSLFKIEDDSIKGIVSFLENKIGYRCPTSVIYEHESFELGKTLFKKDFLENKNISHRIMHCCLMFRENSNQNDEKFKLK